MVEYVETLPLSLHLVTPILRIESVPQFGICKYHVGSKLQVSHSQELLVETAFHSPDLGDDLAFPVIESCGRDDLIIQFN